MIQAILSLVRHALTAIGAQFVASGYLSSDDLSSAVGAVLTLVGLAWSIYNGRKNRAIQE